MVSEYWPILETGGFPGPLRASRRDGRLEFSRMRNYCRFQNCRGRCDQNDSLSKAWLLVALPVSGGRDVHATKGQHYLPTSGNLRASGGPETKTTPPMSSPKVS